MSKPSKFKFQNSKWQRAEEHEDSEDHISEDDIQPEEEEDLEELLNLLRGLSRGLQSQNSLISAMQLQIGTLVQHILPNSTLISLKEQMTAKGLATQ